jgi:predicted Zn-dependent protease
VRGDPQAREFAQKAYFLAPGPATAASLGWVLTTTGEPARGLVLLTEAARQIPNDAALQYHLAYAYAASGEKAKAETALRGLLAAFPNFTDRPAAVRLLSTVVEQK